MPAGNSKADNAFNRAEQWLSQRADEHLPTLDLADRSSDALGRVLQAFNLPKRTPEQRDDEWRQTLAVINLGINAARSLRSMMVLLRHGYEPEAIALQRRLIEAQARILRVIDPVSGPDHARQFLKGEDGTAGKAVSALPKDLWKGLNNAAHADYRAIEQHLLSTDEEGSTRFYLVPRRRETASNMLLVLGAGHVLSAAAEIGKFKAIALDPLMDVLPDFYSATERWLTPPETDT
ncbi:MAG TPA: hypothetical protein VF517_04935 [Thermoleophilaceae bacterium]|jgi:hypothetical protein